MNAHNRITIDPNICHGKPTIRGLRYPVETMLELFSSGMGLDEILDDYRNRPGGSISHWSKDKIKA